MELSEQFGIDSVPACVFLVVRLYNKARAAAPPAATPAQEKLLEEIRDLLKTKKPV